VLTLLDYVTRIHLIHRGFLISSVVNNKKLNYCWETVRCESMPRIAEMDVEMTT